MNNSPEDQRIIDEALARQREKAQAPAPEVPVPQEVSVVKQRGSSTTVVSPISGVLPVLNLKSLDNWRAFTHQVVAVVVPILVTANIVTENQALAWIPFVFAIADNVLSLGNTDDKVRRVIYASVGALQAGGLVTSLVGGFAPDLVPIAGASLSVISAFLARFYTPTTTMVPS